MKPLKTIVLILFIAILAINTQAQKTAVATPNHSHPVYEKELQEMKTAKDNADKTYQLAQDNYNAIKEYDRRMDAREKCFFTSLQIFIALLAAFGLGTFFYNNFLTRKAREDADIKMKAEVEKVKKDTIELHANEIKRITAENEKIIKEIIAKKGKDSEIRKNARILVINHKETPVSLGFKKVLGLFDSFDFDRDIINVDKLSDSIRKNIVEKLKKADLIIIENQDHLNRWNINERVEPDSNSISEVNEDTPDLLSDTKQNKSLMVKLANEICDKTSLVYYGPGLFPIENVEPDKQHLIAFANSPSTLYSNIMNMLKFQDVLKSEI